MSLKPAIAFTLLLVTFAFHSAIAQDDLSFYPVRTLAEARKDSIDLKAKADFYFDDRALKSRSTVTFTGETRKLTDKRRKFVELWLESRRMRPQVITILDNEAQFQEGTTIYWMPIRQATLDLMRDNKKGDRVDIYTVLAGAVSIDDKIEFMFIVGGVSQ